MFLSFNRHVLHIQRAKSHVVKVTQKNKEMKHISCLLLMTLLSFNALSQRFPYHYEMSIQETESSHYYIEYSESLKTDTVKIILQITDLYGNNIQRNVLINDSLLKTDEFGFLHIVLDHKKPLRVHIDNLAMSRNVGFSKCLFFWDWDEKQAPSKIVVVLGSNYPSIIHIDSDVQLKNTDFREIKNKLLGKKYNEEIFDHVRIRKVVYL